MKRSIMFAVVLVAAAASSTWAGQIANAGFEVVQEFGTGHFGLGDWYGNQAEMVTAENGVTPIEGVRMIHYLDPNATSNLRQVIELEGFAGGPVTLSAEVYHTAGSSPLSQFRLQLADVNEGAPFDNSDFDNHMLAVSWHTVPVDVWTTISISAVVPPGTGFLGVEVSYLSGGLLTGYADNLRLAGVPEPSSFVLAALGLIGLVAWRLRRRSSITAA